ncbi:phosphatidylinositol-binding protein scs2 [Dissophora globulifera]|uniref:Phosphatidylinositol-binding protein scs2 n=1 Tax=Dissophora globulifera TaxID=979702 RepID=A0A9P6RFQ4_9FUNG|nr:phosphatidylinositol-binding protein scs2 [Dissophora globulifera]KAG0319152.1 phosphatidylinositol-binding protein scs2 [Dissophora globulifera]
MSIELEPSGQLSFRRPLTEAIKENLIIRNPTQLPIAFKVKTTAPKQYCVRPNSGRVEPGQELEVQVQMQAMREDPPADFKCKDKFLVQSVAITAEREQLAPSELWPTMEKDARDQIREKKIRCVFLPAIDHAITQIKEEDENGTHSSNTSNGNVAYEPPAYRQEMVDAPVSHVQRSSADSSSEVLLLRRELETSERTIQDLERKIASLQKETTTLRQRKPDSSSSSAPTFSAVHLNNQAQGNYPLNYVVGAALTAFIFAYLFF